MSPSSNPDIRWVQRFDNLLRALKLLEEAAALPSPSMLETEGLIQRFEYTYELAWNTLKDYLTEQGISGIIGPRDAIRQAFNKELIEDGAGWMQMLQHRHRTSHTYDEALARQVADDVRQRYTPYFRALVQRLQPEADALTR